MASPSLPGSVHSRRGGHAVFCPFLVGLPSPAVLSSPLGPAGCVAAVPPPRSWTPARPSRWPAHQSTFPRAASCHGRRGPGGRTGGRAASGCGAPQAAGAASGRPMGSRGGPRQRGCGGVASTRAAQVHDAGQNAEAALVGPGQLQAARLSRTNSVQGTADTARAPSLRRGRRRRAGWLGPLALLPQEHRRRVGRALEQQPQHEEQTHLAGSAWLRGTPLWLSTAECLLPFSRSSKAARAGNALSRRRHHPSGSARAQTEGRPERSGSHGQEGVVGSFGELHLSEHWWPGGSAPGLRGCHQDRQAQ